MQWIKYILKHTVTYTHVHIHTHGMLCSSVVVWSSCRCCTWQLSQTPVRQPPHLAGTADNHMAINLLSHTEAWVYIATHTSTHTYSHWLEDNCGTSHSHCQNTDRQWGSKKDRRPRLANVKPAVVWSLFPKEKKIRHELHFPMALQQHTNKTNHIMKYRRVWSVLW